MNLVLNNMDEVNYDLNCDLKFGSTSMIQTAPQDPNSSNSDKSEMVKEDSE